MTAHPRDGFVEKAGRLGLRQKAIGAMAATLALIMLAVGFIVYQQVLGQLKSSLEALGKELIKNVRSESLFDLLYEQKEKEDKRLAKLIRESEDVIYVMVVRPATGDKVQGLPFDVFSAAFSQPGKPLAMGELISRHMSAPERIIEHEDFIGLTERIQVGGEEEMTGESEGPEKPAVDGGQAATEAEGEEEEEEALLHEGVEPAGTEKKPTPAVEKGGTWGYVLLGLGTAKIQAQKTRLLQTLSLVLVVALLAFTVFLYWASTRIYNRLLEMSTVAAGISQGDLTKTVTEARGDEIGLLSGALNRIAANLNNMMGKIAGVTDGLSGAMDRIIASTEEIAQGAEYQVAAVDDTSSSMAEMVTSLKGVAENVEVLATAAEESSSSILEMAAANDEVADNINSLASSVDQTTASMEEMTQSIKEVAKNVEDLSATTEQTSSSMREIDVSIRQVESNANQTATLSEEVHRDAEQGTEAVKKTIEGISNISDSTGLAFSAMEELGRKVQAIGQILTVIDDVAEQTNLLALNAAIIAAQAGEHGKGFAVVADEIKDLAERTATSTSEISDLIGAVQSETRRVLSAMERSRQAVEQGVGLSREAEKALREILASATKSTQMVREIARATVEQARGSKVVTDAITRIADNVQQIASATSQQAKGSEQIMSSAERMRVITQHVHGSSQEQARGSKQIASAIESISEMVHHLNKAQKEQTRGAEQVMHAIERIKEVAESHSQSMGNMKKVVDQVAELSESLRQEMARFKL